MAIRNYKPTTPGRRKMSTLINDEITKATPEKKNEKADLISYEEKAVETSEATTENAE